MIIIYPDCRCVGVKRIVSLCDYTGIWSKPYKKAGYKVLRVDPKISPNRTVENFKKYLQKRKHFECHGLLMAPPCTAFSASGSRYWTIKDKNGDTETGLELVNLCLEIKEMLSPCWWVLENPIGRLPTLLKGKLGKPLMYFDPCDYGDPYTKRTALWGEFNPDLPKNPVDPVYGSLMHKIGGSVKDRREIRSITPRGFAKAFFKANP